VAWKHATYAQKVQEKGLGVQLSERALAAMHAQVLGSIPSTVEVQV
jgi:hypothetical protein